MPETQKAQKVDLKKVHEAAEVEIDRFDTLFQQLGNTPLIRSERALLRTYLVAKATRPELSDPQAP